MSAIFATLLGALVLWPAPALAAEGYEPSLFVAVVKMFAALAVCLGVLIGGVHLLRRFNLVDQGRGEAMIKVVATRALGPKRYVSVVEVGGLLLVLGVAEGGISLLTRLPGAEGDLREPGQAGLPRGYGCEMPEEFLG